MFTFSLMYLFILLFLFYCKGGKEFLMRAHFALPSIESGESNILNFHKYLKYGCGIGYSV